MTHHHHSMERMAMLRHMRRPHPFADMAGGPFAAPGRGPAEEGRGRRGRKGMFEAAELQLLLLHLIAERPRHGYDLIAAVEELTGGRYAPSPGVVYPTLTLLLDMELIAEVDSEGSRRNYRVTEAGEAQLAEKAELLEALQARLRELSSQGKREEASPVRRALENLHAVVRNKVAGRDLSQEALFEIVEMIDETARRIERS